MVTTTKLDEVNEVNEVNVLTERVEKRKEEVRSATPHFCPERSRLVTESWKETEGESLDIRRAKLFEKIMEGNPIAIREGELIVGTPSKHVRGGNPPVDFSPEFTLCQFRTPDSLKLDGMVRTAGVTEGEKDSLLEDAHYWEDKSPADAIIKAQREVFGDIPDDLAKARVVVGKLEDKQTAGSHGKVEPVINKGLNAIIAEAKEGLQKISSFSDKDDIDKYHFLQAVVISCEAAINFAHRYAELAREMAGREGDAVRKKELEKIADICQWVPANPPRSFYEGVQSLWFTHLCLQLEHGYHSLSPGRIDQYLYPFYARDLEEGRLTRQDAAELLGCLWVKFNEILGVKTGTWKEGTQSNFPQDITLGGVDREGKDATNELTYLILEVVRQTRMAQPAAYLRCHTDTPEELWMKAAEGNRERGDGQPAFISDRAVLLSLVGKGIPLQEARDWYAGGCVHPFVNGFSPGHRFFDINTAKIFELTLNNGFDPQTGKQLGLVTGDPRDFSSFVELYEALKKQFDYFISLFAQIQRLERSVRSSTYSYPFQSALTPDCISNGRSTFTGGIRYQHLTGFSMMDRGHQNAGDSLVAIKKLVFEEKKLTMDRLLEALKANFEGNGNEEIQRMLLAAPKYGNDDDYADRIHDDLSLWLQRRIHEEKGLFGENCHVRRGGATTHFYFGKGVGALPDGRKGWAAVADGAMSPVQGADVKGPTAVINSASRVNHYEFSSSGLFNMKLSPAAVSGREGLQRFIALLKTYFDRGGFMIQFNMGGTETLREAKEHPERYRDLLVRVAGFSAYFVELSPALQDEIIARTEHAW